LVALVKAFLGLMTAADVNDALIRGC